MAERVVEERERVLAGECHQPQRHLRQVDRDRVAVDAVEAALCDEPAGERDLVLIRREAPGLVVCGPGLDELIGELAARLDEERCRSPSPGRRPSGRGSPRGRGATVAAEALEHGSSVVRTIGSVSDRGV